MRRKRLLRLSRLLRKYGALGLHGLGVLCVEGSTFFPGGYNVAERLVKVMDSSELCFTEKCLCTSKCHIG